MVVKLVGGEGGKIYERWLFIYPKLFTCRLVHYLPEDIHFIAIDFPGHGKSSHRWPGMPYIHFEYIADVKKVVSQLGWERFTIIGHSMGANVASLYAGTFPFEVEKLILLDFGGPGVIFANKTALVLARYASTMSVTKTVTLRSYQSLESAAERRQLPSLENTLRKEDAMLLTERGTRITENGVVFSHDPILKHAYLPFIEPQSLMVSILSNTRCAVLVLQSTDYVLQRIEKEAQVERIKIIYQNATCKLWKRVKGAHHFHLENPEQVAQEIKEFLALCKSQSHTAQSKL